MQAQFLAQCCSALLMHTANGLKLKPLIQWQLLQQSQSWMRCLQLMVLQSLSFQITGPSSHLLSLKHFCSLAVWSITSSQPQTIKQWMGKLNNTSRNSKMPSMQCQQHVAHYNRTSISLWGSIERLHTQSQDKHSQGFSWDLISTLAFIFLDPIICTGKLQRSNKPNSIPHSIHSNQYKETTLFQVPCTWVSRSQSWSLHSQETSPTRSITVARQTLQAAHRPDSCTSGDVQHLSEVTAHLICLNGVHFQWGLLEIHDGSISSNIHCAIAAACNPNIDHSCSNTRSAVMWGHCISECSRPTIMSLPPTTDIYTKLNGPT